MQKNGCLKEELYPGYTLVQEEYSSAIKIYMVNNQIFNWVLGSGEGDRDFMMSWSTGTSMVPLENEVGKWRLQGLISNEVQKII